MSVPYLKLVIELFEAQYAVGGGALFGMTSYRGLHESYDQAEDQPNGQARPLDLKGGHCRQYVRSAP